MARLILILLFAAVIVITVSSVMSLVRFLGGADPRPASGPQMEFSMPGAVQTIAFVLLVVLMFGVVTGLIGGL